MGRLSSKDARPETTAAHGLDDQVCSCALMWWLPCLKEGQTVPPWLCVADWGLILGSWGWLGSAMGRWICSTGQLRRVGSTELEALPHTA